MGIVFDSATSTGGNVVFSSVGGTNPYTLLSASHGTAHPNSLLGNARFASTGDVRFGVVSDTDQAKVQIDWQAISDGQLWLKNINHLDAVTVSATADATATATLSYLVVDTGATGQFTATFSIAEAVITIVLRDLVPATRKVLNPPTGQPVIATKAEFRDGTRTSEPVAPPPPVDPGADPHDWKTILTGTGGGTVDPTFNPDNFLTYLGAFRITPEQMKTGEVNTVGGTAGASAITYKAPDGTNGANGSLFISRWTGVAEVLIPALSTATTVNSLNDVTVRQPFVNVMSRSPSGNVNNSDRAGWLKVIDNKLYMGTFNYYDNDGNNESLLVALDASDLANSTYAGSFNAWFADYGARYACEIPAVWQPTFGHTHFTGVSPELAIVSRSSFGHSLIGLDLAPIDGATTSVSGTTWAHYPNVNPINGWSPTNGEVAGHYGDLVWTPGEYNLRDWYQEGDTRLFDVGGVDGTGLGAFCFLPIVETGRETTLYQFPLPDPSLRKHALSYEMVCGAALIPPGTDTIAFIGAVKGPRYGQAYKHFYLEDGPGPNYADPSNVPSVGGFAPVSKTDRDNFIWAMNLNDVAARVNTYDPQYYTYTPFNDPGPFNRDKLVVSGHFDTATNKLYLISEGHAYSPYEGQHVVSVYQVGSAV